MMESTVKILKKIMPRNLTVCLAALSLAGLLCAPGVFAAPAATQQVKLQAFVLPATCALSLSGGDMSGNTIDFGDIIAAKVGKESTNTPRKAFNVVVSGCPTFTGAPGSLSPKLVAAGTLVGSSWYGIFNDHPGDASGIYAQGMGIFARQGGSTVTYGSGSLYFLSPSDPIPLTNFLNGGTDATIPFSTWVSCGGQCDVIPRKAGQLVATITLTVEYL